jgi:hypothetical protein
LHCIFSSEFGGRPGAGALGLRTLHSICKSLTPSGTRAGRLYFWRLQAVCSRPPCQVGVRLYRTKICFYSKMHVHKPHISLSCRYSLVLQQQKLPSKVAAEHPPIDTHHWPGRRLSECHDTWSPYCIVIPLPVVNCPLDSPSRPHFIISVL